jgi:hypothetical protein
MENLSNHPLYRRHSIDSAINSTWEFYKKNFLSLFGIALVMSIINQYTATLINVQEIQSITDPMQMLEKMKEYVGPIMIISVVNLFFTTVLQYYIIHKPLDGTKTVITAFVHAFRYFLPFLIIMVLLAFFGSIAIILGVFALIVGALFAALYIMTLYMFVLPILMIEGHGIGHTIARTFSLAHRNFWQNIGWVSVYIILLIVISVIFSALIMIPFAGNFMKNLFNPGETAALSYVSNPIYIGLSALAGALTFPIMPIFACILYFNARASEDEKKNVQPVVTEYRPTVEDLYAKPRSEEHPDNQEIK